MLLTMGPARRSFALGLLIAMASNTTAMGAEILRISGSTTVNPVVGQAAEVLTDRHGGEIRIDTLGGSSGGILCLAEGRCDLAMSSRPISDEDRRRFPTVDFRSYALGWDAVALVVSRDVWEGGIDRLSARDVRRLYEGEIERWSELGGPDRRVVFFDKEPGRGTWEVFANWLYGSSHQAPAVRWPQVGANEEARTKVASTPGAITQLSAAWADGQRVFALALGEPSQAVDATAESIRSGAYPLVRPLLLVSDGEPAPTARRLIDFLLVGRGRALPAAHGYQGLSEANEMAAP